MDSNPPKMRPSWFVKSTFVKSHSLDCAVSSFKCIFKKVVKIQKESCHKIENWPSVRFFLMESTFRYYTHKSWMCGQFFPQNHEVYKIQNLFRASPSSHNFPFFDLLLLAMSCEAATSLFLNGWSRMGVHFFCAPLFSIFFWISAQANRQRRLAQLNLIVC